LPKCVSMRVALRNTGPCPVTSFVGALLLTSAVASPKSPWLPVAGTGKSGFGGDTFRSLRQDFAIETKLNSPWGLALDTGNDRLYVADTLSHVVRSIDLSTGLMETVIGTGRPGFVGDGFAAVDAKLHMPTGLALDVSRQILYVSDTNNHRVRAVALRIGNVYQAESNVADGLTVVNNCPVGLDPKVTELLRGSKYCAGSTGAGHVQYVHSIRDYTEFTVSATFGAGSYELRFRYADRYDEVHAAGMRKLRLYVNNVVLSHEVLFPPTGKLQDGRRDVFEWVVREATFQAGVNIVKLEVTGRGGPHIDQLYVVPARPAITTVAGLGIPGAANDLLAAQPATVSKLHTPLGLALDEPGRRLYIADSDNLCVRVLDIVASTLRTVAGGVPTGSGRDGIQAKDGKLFRPAGLILNSARTYLYVADAVGDRVKRVDLTNALLEGGTIITIVGTADKHSPFDMTVRAPQDLALDESTNTLYITDREHARIRAVDLSAPGGQCPNRVLSRFECAFEGISQVDCENLGCCYDADHPDCKSPLNQDGRAAGYGLFPPTGAYTKLEQALSSPEISFVASRSGRCCYPRSRDMTTLDLLDSPQGMVWDPRDKSLYVTQTKRHRVVKLLTTEARCGKSVGNVQFNC